MKLWGVSMVRNEEDIVEAFVRHNLTVLDGLFVVDHSSSDRTLAILQALCAERLPLVLTRSEAPGYLQAEIMSTAAREVFARASADYVFPIDADEFLHAPSRERLERAVGAIPPGHVGRAAWVTYVPAFDDATRDVAALVRGARRFAKEAPVPHPFDGKSVLSREFASIQDAFLSMGSHEVVVGRDPSTAWRVRHVDLPPHVVRVCHVPVRSRAQYVAKTAVRTLARIAAGRAYPPGSNRRREYDTLRGDARLSPGTMLRRYIEGVDDAGAFDPVLPDTIEDPFLAPVELRYGSGALDDPFPRVLAAVEHMTRGLAERRRPDRGEASPAAPMVRRSARGAPGHG